MSKITKTAVVSVVGRPNVGKSTLTNKLVGQKVAIVSSKPQTTRTRITGVLSRGETQYVLLDTPGLHKPRSRLGDYMCKVVTDTVSEVDVAVLVVEPIPNIGPAEESLIAQIKQHHMPAILVINKIDPLRGLPKLKVCVAYKLKNGETVTEFPANFMDLVDCEPVYEEFDGFDEDITNCRSFEELPATVQSYIKELERIIECPITMLGVGPARDQVMTIK